MPPTESRDLLHVNVEAFRMKIVETNVTTFTMSSPKARCVSKGESRKKFTGIPVCRPSQKEGQAQDETPVFSSHG